MIKINNLANSFIYLQKIIKQSSTAMGASYTLIGSILILGALGYFIDKWQDTSPLFLLIGLLIGIIVGFYEIAKAIWAKPNK
ncbi:MAG: AtpZ/AtpI family protein [Candidatus Marinimicrobia bacterium]|nr:AtpZ/AtpI family protein [Candidatus Neomarinimicrobiota bacterium]